MDHNPGGDWYPGRGDNPTYVGLVHVAESSMEVVVVKWALRVGFPQKGDGPKWVLNQK